MLHSTLVPARGTKNNPRGGLNKNRHPSNLLQSDNFSIVLVTYHGHFTMVWGRRVHYRTNRGLKLKRKERGRESISNGPKSVPHWWQGYGVSRRVGVQRRVSVSRGRGCQARDMDGADPVSCHRTGSVTVKVEGPRLQAIWRDPKGVSCPACVRGGILYPEDK